ncbi:DUF1801 domain-containing protein [Ruminococcaceae bacterium OttesenSCG-928-I18]|nr:DUF1801 domain-containing protein [Ruminococcaceae bacterium OttesenSCG-928-I18]
MVHTVDDYLHTLHGPAREWVGEYVRFMRENHPDVTEGIIYQIPTYKTRSSCLAFSAARDHFIFHCVSGPWLHHLKNQLPSARCGKDALKIPYGCEEAKPLLYEACNGILAAREPTRIRKAI